LLVDPRNPEGIAGTEQHLLTVKTLGAELTSIGLVRARQFTWEKAAKETLEVFVEIAARREPLRTE